MRFQGHSAHFVEVDGSCPVRPGLVADEVEELSHMRDRSAMGQVPSVGEVHAQDRISRFHKGQVHRLIHGRAGERLHIGVLGAEEPAGALAGGVLDPVREGLPGVVPAAGVALAVLVGQARAHRGHHREGAQGTQAAGR